MLEVKKKESKKMWMIDMRKLFEEKNHEIFSEKEKN